MTRHPVTWPLFLALAVTGSAPANAQPAVSPEARLKALGIELPPAPKPLASYVPAVRSGNLVFLAGQGPTAGGKPVVTGKVGANELPLDIPVEIELVVEIAPEAAAR